MIRITVALRQTGERARGNRFHFEMSYLILIPVKVAFFPYSLFETGNSNDHYEDIIQNQTFDSI